MTSTIPLLSDPTRKVAFHEAGPRRKGTPLILIHGVGMNGAAWSPQIAALSGRDRVIALDMPGHGGSAPLPREADLPAYVAWLRDVIETLGCGPVRLAGHSMGALVAGGFAASYPELTKGVALLNGVYRRSPDARAAVMARAREIRAGRFDLETPLSRWFGASPADQAARQDVAGWLAAVDHGGYATAYAAFAAGDAIYADRFNEIRCPLLALTGADDPNSTPAMARAMAAAAPLGAAVVIPGHRHMVNLTAPEEVSRHLATWMARCAEAKVAP